ncbi:hypothetical protein ACIBJF_40055 [Streptomyces sp. NPDC050743]|uniref:hypothetical protein n=1 Tax=Streptomyces sp. NPDC050743 TaxID=3365634 RepID=UPI0037B2321E
MAGTLAVAAATLLTVGGTASATSDPSVDRTAHASHSSSITVPYGDNRGGDRDSDRDRESSNHRIDRDSSDLYVYDSHPKWERNDHKWHHNDGRQRHSYDGQQFHRWNADKWGTVSAKAHGLNDHTSR